MSLIAKAKIELARANFGDSGTAAMIDILERFFDEWDSGGAVAFALPTLMKLIGGKPLSPLIGDDDEWIEHDYGGPVTYQNKRCSTVFKDVKDGPAYDIQSGPRIAITFPYMPQDARVPLPILEVST